MSKNLLILFFLFHSIIDPTFAQNENGFSNYDQTSAYKQDEIVAEVDSIKISADEFFYSYEFGPAFVKKKPDSKNRHLSYMINEKLLAIDGYARGIDTIEQTKDYLHEFISDLATEELFKQDILSKVEILPSEIDTVINKKQIELEIKWLYSDSEEGIKDYLKKMNIGISFDSLFAAQISDSVFSDERYMKIDRFKLEQKNPLLAKIIDSLKTGEVSVPVLIEDGWYIVKLNNVWENLVATEAEYEKLKQEAVNAVTKRKIDILSDQYVNELMIDNQPVIKRNTFNFLRSYLGNYLLDPEKYKEWNLTSKLNEAIKNLNISDKKEYADAVLVESKNRSFSLKDFLTWYRNRSLYIKLNKNDLQNFSASLERLIWRMIRDRLLSERARSRGLDKTESVTKQAGWWKDKIISAVVKNEIAYSTDVENNEIKTGKNPENETASVKASDEYTAKLLRKILLLKQKYSIVINEDTLDRIPVSVENNPRAVEFYTVKKGGLIPRTPYPTIDFDWVSWE
jgi:hypothetical protein